MLFEELKRQNLIERLTDKSIKTTREGTSIYEASYNDLKWTLVYAEIVGDSDAR